MIYKCPSCHTYSETKDDKMAMVICPVGCGEMVKQEVDKYEKPTR